MFINAAQLKVQRWVSENSFKKRLQYQLKHQKLIKVRKGLYAQPDCRIGASAEDRVQGGALIYTPSYLSYESVLAQAGVLFQRYGHATYAAPYTKTIQLPDYNQAFVFKRLPMALLSDLTGIVHTPQYMQASPERAICDCLYHNLNYPFERLNVLDRDLLLRIGEMYAYYKPALYTRLLSLKTTPHATTTTHS